jgi:hypothetical protein
LAEAPVHPVETERFSNSARFCRAMLGDGEQAVNAGKDKGDVAPPAVFSAPPERDLERELKKRPHDEDLKVDVGSDESMDASDPPAAAQPGNNCEPAPSSGFPDA